MLRLQQWSPAATTNLNVCFGGNCWTLPPYCTWVGITPAATWLPVDNQGLLYVCVFPALRQACLFCGPTGGPWPPALPPLPMETTQPKLKHEQFGEQLPVMPEG